MEKMTKKQKEKFEEIMSSIPWAEKGRVHLKIPKSEEATLKKQDRMFG